MAITPMTTISSMRVNPPKRAQVRPAPHGARCMCPNARIATIMVETAGGGVHNELIEWMLGMRTMQRTLDYAPFDPASASRWLKAAYATALLYPFLLVSAFYVAWLIAWAKL